MNSRKFEVRCRLRLSAVLVEACDEPQGTCGERYLGPRRRVRGIRRAALRLRGDGTLARRMGVHGDLLRIRLGDHSLVGPPRPRTLGRAVVRPGTEGTTTLGQGVRGRDHAALCRLADLDAPGCREIRMVGGACLLTDLGSSGTGAHFVHRVLDLPGERVSRPGGKGASGEGPECGDQRPVPVREASHVCEHVTVLPGKCTVVRLVGRPAVLCGASGATRLEDYPRSPDAKNELPGYDEYARNVRYRLIPIFGDYSPECVEVEFCELRYNGVLGSSANIQN